MIEHEIKSLEKQLKLLVRLRPYIPAEIYEIEYEKIKKFFESKSSQIIKKTSRIFN